jgi:formate dehydrogenase assembly factor FdhD
MNFFTRIFNPPKPEPRSVLDVATCRVLVEHAFKGATQSNYRAFWTKGAAQVCTDEDIEKASKKSYSPWKLNVWECEDQARSLIEHLQRTAANAGHTRAAGMLFADPPTMFQDAPRHVYIFAIIGSNVAFFDPTARQWCERPKNIYFSLL